ncbi:MAG TPA: hypothetical protein VEQ59_16375, partial [Polyangiaceae bacterium]|nr:hypothetical protein [Polyangiaceae bacterium]
MNEVEQALRAARRELEPSAADRERVRRRLRASAAGLGVAASLATKSSAAATSLKLTLLFFGGMFVTLVGSSVVVAVMDRSSAPVTVPRARTAPAAAPMPSTAPPPVPTPSAVTTPERRPHAAPAAAPSIEAPAPAAPSGGLQAELALLREARQASAGGNLSLAKQLLDRLDSEHPQSTLLEERGALRAITDCRGAAAFFQRYPGSVYAAKVRRA